MCVWYVLYNFRNIIRIHRHVVGFQIQTMCDESDIQKWLQEEYKEPKGE